MPTPTYDLIASNVLSSSAASVSFSSIPATYRDLVLVINAKNDAGGSSERGVQAQFNSDTGSNYFRVGMVGTGSATSSFSQNNDYMSVGNSRGDNFDLNITQIMDYSATDKHKSALNRISSAATIAQASRWANTSAISSIYIYLAAGNFVSGSSFYLYGIVS